MRTKSAAQGTKGIGAKTAAIALAVLCVFAIGAQGAGAAAPQITGTTVSAVGTTIATLEAEVNPEGKETLYRFEYGPSDCSISACTKTTEGKLPAGSSPLAIKATLEGLSPGTVYHFRAVVRNGETANGPDRVFATYLTQAPGLPDGRAYEQASPLEKDGGDAVGEFALVKAADDGEGITFGSAFGIPGGKGAQALPTFLAGRGAGQSGWSTQGLLPPADTGQRAQVLGWSPDLSETYSNAAKLGSPFASEALVAQSTTGGPPTFITPYVSLAQYSFAGASKDGSVVLFESTKKVPVAEGPEGIQGAPNLYAWNRESGELKLAGALNDESSPPLGAFAGPYTWARGITGRNLREGGGAQRHYLQDQHAITPDGSVYFTEAGTGRLYLRRNPTRPQSAMEGERCSEPEMACTIPVSATEKTNGKGPAGADPAGTQPAAFVGASKDGSKAFFTSPEKLTDDANTGPEQPAAAIGRGNSASGAIEEAEFIPAHAVGVATDSEYVYWADPAKGTIGRAKLDGTEVNDSFIAPGETECEVEIGNGTGVFEKASAPSRPRYVAVDSGHLYWTNSGPLEAEANQPIEGCGTIGRAKLDGTEVEEDFIGGQIETSPGKFEEQVSNPQGIAVNASHIYWANAPEDLTRRSIARAEVGGTGVEAGFFEVTTAFVPYGVTLDAAHIYFSVNNDAGDIGSIRRISLEGEEEEFVGIGKAGIRGVALDAGHLYWATQGEAAIGRIALADFPKLGPCSGIPSCDKQFIPIEGALNGLAADSTHLYWSVNGEAASNPGNDLYRFEADAKAGERLSDLSIDPTGDGAEVLGVLGTSADGSAVYFAANGDLDGAGPAVAGNCQTSEPHGSLGSLRGQCNVYLWQEGTPIRLVARVDAEGDTLNWVPTPEDLFGAGSYAPKTSFVSEDGSTLLFRSQEKLTPYDNEGVPELYRFEAGATPPISCVSCPPSGEAVGAGPDLGSIVYPGLRPPHPYSVSARNLSADGTRAFFETAEALSPLDTNGQGGCPLIGNAGRPACEDVYEWEAPQSGSCKESSPSYSPLDNGCIYLISTGKSKFPALFADASESGKDVFFFTRDQLVGQDEDELQDVYDARVEGGLASQSPVKPQPCESAAACHEAPPPAPSEATPATPGFSGPQNPKPKHQKPKKPKKQKHKKKHNPKKHKRANTEQGASR